MPVRAIDGEMTTYDYDGNGMEMATFNDDEQLADRVRELAWVVNQLVPGSFDMALTLWRAVQTERLQFCKDFDGWRLGEQVGSGMTAFTLAAGFLQPTS